MTDEMTDFSCKFALKVYALRSPIIICVRICFNELFLYTHIRTELCPLLILTRRHFVLEGYAF